MGVCKKLWAIRLKIRKTEKELEIHSFIAHICIASFFLLSLWKDCEKKERGNKVVFHKSEALEEKCK